ncbi:hypothetical protein [Streptomyces sp. NPDC095613]|uniref:hypothetical protein n=1 Tax=Streptomyces sp. NPDC095613 TaxID=3155540 RepID=UPI00332C27FC
MHDQQRFDEFLVVLVLIQDQEISMTTVEVHLDGGLLQSRPDRFNSGPTALQPDQAIPKGASAGRAGTALFR